MKIIINLDKLIEYKDSNKLNLLAGKDVIVMHAEDNMPIDLFGALMANRINAEFLKMGDKEDPEKEAFQFGYMLGSLQQDIICIGEIKYAPTPTRFKFTVISDIKNLAKASGSAPRKVRTEAVKEGKEGAAPVRRRRRSTSAEPKTEDPAVQPAPVEEKIQTEPEVTEPIIEEAPKSTKKEPSKRVPLKFKSILTKSGIEALATTEKPFDILASDIYQSVKAAPEVVSFDIQLKIHLLDKDLSANVYTKLKNRFSDLKTIAG